jgi:DNA-binding transcriptional LysR family regulator
MNDRFHELEVFLRVAEEASFSAAARRLDCDPSTVSKLIQRLENRLAVRLFQRNSRSLALTPEGARFLEAAQRVVEALEAAEGLAGPSGQALAGVLRINSALAFAQYHVAPILGEFLARHPRLRVEFVLTATPVDLIEQQIDVSLRGGYIPDSSLVAKRVATSRWVVCAAPAYLARAGTPATPADLAHHNCLNFLPGAFRSTWPMREDGHDTGVQVGGNVGANSPDLLRALALEGLGIVRLSEFHVGRDLARGALVPVLADHQADADEPVFAVFASRRHLSPRVKAFLDFLDEKLGSAGAAGARR